MTDSTLSGVINQVNDDQIADQMVDNLVDSITTAVDDLNLNERCSKTHCPNCGRYFSLVKKFLKHINKNNCDIKTFNKLFKFLQACCVYFDFDFIEWLKNKWDSKNKQESVLRLFAALGCIEKLYKFSICKGNFNNGTITPYKNCREIFYKSEDKIYLNDKGDASDLTGISDDKYILATTSKDLNNYSVGKLDIDKICNIFNEKYKPNGYKLILCICVRSRKDFMSMVNKAEASSSNLVNLINDDSTIIIDWDDLKQAFNQFKKIYIEPIESILDIDMKPIVLKPHQELGVTKTIRLKNEGNKKILWGHIQRSGKSYITAGCISADSIGKDKCNYLVITTAPKETIDQQSNVFNCLQLIGFNVIVLNGSNKKPKLAERNIIICSKQFLQTKITEKSSNKKEIIEKTTQIRWLKNMEFDMRFIDESHNGGTTELAQKTLNFYGSKSFTVQITATYSKPINDYDIPRECWILWDLEDIKLCKCYNDKSRDKLIEKHGNEFGKIFDKYSVSSILNEYSKYPDLYLLTDDIEPGVKADIINATADNSYGWSTKACFLLKQCMKKNKDTGVSEKQLTNKFQSEENALELWYRIFGKYDKFGIPDKKYPDNKVHMKRIKKMCNNPSTESRYIGTGDFTNEPMIIMAFLPQGNIDMISKATKKLLIDNHVIDDYHIAIINSKTTGDPKNTIEESRIIARNEGKKGVLVLSGKQCSLGVTIKNCDIVILLNNNTSFDMIYQMMFRCMTEGKNKRNGFVIDMNIHRATSVTIVEYAAIIKPGEHPKDAIKYILEEKLITVNGDKWLPAFGNVDKKLDKLCSTIYKNGTLNATLTVDKFLSRLANVPLTKGIMDLFKLIVIPSNKNPKQVRKNADELLEKITKKNNIKDGIEKTIVGAADDTDDDDADGVDKKPNPSKLLQQFIPLICLLTININETSLFTMIDIVKKDKKIYNTIIKQLRLWWGNSISEKILDSFVELFREMLQTEKSYNQTVITIKELFMMNLGNMRTLSELIDKYLVPQELEKKTNAEVSTPFQLRQDMLDKIPTEFWNKPRKVFEPCCGKGGFLIDIIDRFMLGLKTLISDEHERHRVIIEECLYFSDINETNIYIVNILINTLDKYKTNYNLGNTLEIDIKKKWNLDGFDAVIGNPPYQNNCGNKGKGNTLWDKFVIISLQLWLIPDGYLVFVHPQGWRQLGNKTGKIMLSKQLTYLNMNSVNEGQKVFGCSTTFDYYVLKNKSYSEETIINDYKNKEYSYNLTNVKFIPNHSINLVNEFIDYSNEDGLIKDRSIYGTEKKWVSKIKSDIFKYPCIYSINKSNELSLRWSSKNDKGHFDVIKYIISNGCGLYKDTTGKYGCTEWAYHIKCNIEDMDDIEKCFKNTKFLNIIDAVKLTSNKYNYVILKHLKNKFWKEFV